MRSSWLTVATKSFLSSSSCLSCSLAALQLLRGRAQLGRLRFETVAVFADLRGFVEDFHHLIEAGLLLFDHGCHQDARRRRADGAGELTFGELDDPCICQTGIYLLFPLPIGVTGKRRVRPLLADETRQEMA